jgi:hypothetical protein
MTRTKLYAAAAVAVAVAALAGTAAAVVPGGTLDRIVGQSDDVAAVGDAGGQQYQQIAIPDGSWKYGAQLFFEAGSESSGNPVTVTTSTPDVCVPYGSTSSGLRFVGTGGCAVTLTQAGDSSYATATVQLSRMVDPRTLFVSVGDASRPTNSPNPTFEAVYDGFVHGDTAAVVTTAPKFMVPPPGAQPGAYPIVPYGAVAENYVFDYTPGVLTVTAAMPNPTY